MKRIAVLGCVTIGAVAVLAQTLLDYSLGPDSQPQPGVPVGTVTKHVLAHGKYFPGTPHNYQVYVPAQYDAGRPIAYMIFLDGSGYAGNGVRVPAVLDNLIARHDVPPMIAIFIDPGVMPALSDAAQNRYERIFEYDSLTPRFASFLIEELVPEVARTYNLSKDPNDHGIAGISTGGVGAFVAAWSFSPNGPSFTTCGGRASFLTKQPANQSERLICRRHASARNDDAKVRSGRKNALRSCRDNASWQTRSWRTFFRLRSEPYHGIC